MDVSHGKRILTLACCLLTATAILATGCADFGGPAPWARSSPAKPTGLADVSSPAERIARLQKLASRGSRASAEQRQQVATELARTIREEADPLIRAEIVRTLGEYPCATADQVLRQALSDPEAEIRLTACEAWAKRPGAEAAKLLAEALRGDVDIDVRLAAAGGLADVKDPAGVAALGEALEDRDPALQYRAMLSLKKATGEDFGNDVRRWKQYVQSGPPVPPEPVSITERLRRLF